MLSIAGQDFSYWVAPEPLAKRFFNLLGLTDLGRQKYFYPAVDMSRNSVQQLDNIIHASMARINGKLVTSYSSVAPGRQRVRREFLEEVLGSNKVEDKIHDLRFKLSKGGCRVHVILSRRKVLLRFLGGAEHEPLKRNLEKSVAGVLKKSKAPFLKRLFFLTAFMFAAFGVMWLAELWGAKFSTQIILNVVALLSTIVLLPLITVHYKGTYLPYTTITLVESKTDKKVLDIALLITLFSSLVDIVKMIVEWVQRVRARVVFVPNIYAQAKMK